MEKLNKINDLKEQIKSRDVNCAEKDKKLEVLEQEHTKLEQEHQNLVKELEECKKRDEECKKRDQKYKKKIEEITQIAIKSVELSEKLRAKHCREDEPGGAEESKVVDVKDVVVNVNARVEEEGEGKVEDGRKKKKSGKKKSGKKKSIKKKSIKKKSIKKMKSLKKKKKVK